MNLARSLLAAAFAVVLSACQAQELPMKQSTTYLHLLKKTPFFTSLDKNQLRWVIDHSTEWETQAGTEISNRLDADQHVWILLDGGWQVEQGGETFKAGHADPAKWYGGPGAALLPPDSRLVVNEHSYVMRIARADFALMLERGFGFAPHLAQGEAFYRASAGASAASRTARTSAGAASAAKPNQR